MKQCASCRRMDGWRC